jgi:tetratricopeptide (TPR) repeat protein
MGTVGGQVNEIEQGLEIATRVNDIQQTTRGYNNLAEALLEGGDFAAVGPLYDAARSTAERFGHRLALRWVDAQDGIYRYAIGDWDAAAGLLDRYLAEVESGSPHYLESVARLARAQLRYARGDTAGALEDGERSVAAGRAARDPQALAVLSSYARLLISEGRKEEALRLIEELLQTGFVPFHVAYDIAWVIHEVGAESASFPLPEQNEPWRSLVDALLQGELVEAAGRLGELGLRVDEAQARLRAARDLVAKGNRVAADEQLTRALGFFRPVGATRYVREGEALLAASA